jgi:hypothetical protein
LGIALAAATVAAVTALCVVRTANAEMGADDYRVGQRRSTAAERDEDAARALAEREREAQAERERRALAEVALRQELARRAALPRGARLAEEQCTGCHPASTYASTRRSALGWTLVLLRMRWLNGAETGTGEITAIVGHLARDQGVSRAREIAEIGLLTGAAAAYPLWRCVRRVRRPHLRGFPRE